MKPPDDTGAGSTATTEEEPMEELGPGHSKRDGEKAAELQVSDFKVLDHVDAEAFDRPK